MNSYPVQEVCLPWSNPRVVLKSISCVISCRAYTLFHQLLIMFNQAVVAGTSLASNIMTMFHWIQQSCCCCARMRFSGTRASSLQCYFWSWSWRYPSLVWAMFHTYIQPGLILIRRMHGNEQWIAITTHMIMSSQPVYGCHTSMSFERLSIRCIRL